MQIKKYTGATLKEAADKMKVDLGSEALILSSRMIKDLPGYKLFEITAGIENTRQNESVPYLKQEIASKNSNYSLPRREERPQSKERPQVKERPQLKERSQVKENAGNVDDLKVVVETLFNQEVNKNIISSIITELKKYKGFLRPENIDNYVMNSISSILPSCLFTFTKSNKPKTVALVGPTGVGKTTCIAKIAVIAKMVHNLKIGLISTDTYRLGAIDQLKIFSEISNIDMLVAYSPEDMVSHYNSFADKDIILIDTAGRSQKNTDQILKTKEYLEAINIDEVFLVMSSASGTRTLYDIAEKFGPLNYNAAVFTKIDEAAVFGNILNVIVKYKVPAVYLTNGQVIPDDIIGADTDFIAKMVYKGKTSK